MNVLQIFVLQAVLLQSSLHKDRVVVQDELIRKVVRVFFLVLNGVARIELGLFGLFLLVLNFITGSLILHILVEFLQNVQHLVKRVKLLKQLLH